MQHIIKLVQQLNQEGAKVEFRLSCSLDGSYTAAVTNAVDGIVMDRAGEQFLIYVAKDPVKAVAEVDARCAKGE